MKYIDRGGNIAYLDKNGQLDHNDRPGGVLGITMFQPAVDGLVRTRDMLIRPGGGRTSSNRPEMGMFTRIIEGQLERIREN